MNPGTIASRMARLRGAMAADGADLVALGPGAHMEWLLGFHPHADERACLLLVSETDAAMLMPTTNVGDSASRTDIPFFEWRDNDGPGEALAAALASLGGEPAVVALDEAMRTDFSMMLLDSLPRSGRCLAERLLGPLRIVKDEGEFLSLKRSAQIADRAMSAAMAAARPGMSETEVAAVIKDVFATEGARTLFVIVAAGAGGAEPHHSTGPTRIKEGDALLIDTGCRKGGYPSDITRVGFVGEQSEEFRKVHGAVEAAFRAAFDAARPGIVASEVDRAARGVIEQAGYGEYFIHRTGHGLGVEIHEPPYLTSTSDTVLQEGMVFSIEPGIYLPGRFGVRLEDVVILRADGPEILSEIPRECMATGG